MPNAQRPQPIATAPLDGTVILTDKGICMYRDQRHWGSPITNGWVACSPTGDTYTCADNGPYYESPTCWVPLPEWMRAVGGKLKDIDTTESQSSLNRTVS